MGGSGDTLLHHKALAQPPPPRRITSSTWSTNTAPTSLMMACSYHPFPIVFSRAEGSTIWDPEGNKYLDFLSAYSAVNQGHCHPKVMKALIDQAQRLTLSSRAFHNDKFPVFAEYLTSIFGYDMVLPMNTGAAEAVETALKIARKWGYEKKKIPKDDLSTKFLNINLMLPFLDHMIPELLLRH